MDPFPGTTIQCSSNTKVEIDYEIEGDTYKVLRITP